MGVAVSLRFRAMLVLAALCALLLAVAVWLGGAAVDTIRRNDAAALAREHALFQRQKLLTLIERELALAQRFAQLQTTRAWLAAEADPVARTRFAAEAEGFRRAFADRAYFVAVDASGHYYFADDRTSAAQPRYTLSRGKRDDGWYYATLATVRDAALNVNRDATLGQTKVWFNVVVRDDAGRPLGLVGSGLDLTRFLNEFVAAGRVGVGNLIVDGRRAIQAHPDPKQIEYASFAKARSDKTLDRLLAEPAERAALAAAMARLKAGAPVATLPLTLSGAPREVGVAYLPSLDWYVLSAVDPVAARVLDEAFFGRLAMVGLAVLALFALAASFGLDRLVLRPLGRLSRSVEKMAAGDYQIELASARRDELGALTRAFAAMAAEVRRHTGALETRVAERTRELAETNARLAGAQRSIEESLRYAAMIQSAMLPTAPLAEAFGDAHYLMWLPRDTVGGDACLYRADETGRLIGLIDCAGHGVPGAFMTLVARAAFDLAVAELGLADPAALLARIDAILRAEFARAPSRLATSVDAAFCYLPADGSPMLFAGAHLSLFVAAGGRCVEYPGSPHGLAERRTDAHRNLAVELAPDAVCTLATDGFFDQAGGDKGFGFGRQRFIALLAELAPRPLAEQRAALLAALDAHRGDAPLRDDITVLGFRHALPPTH
ncbi:biofilm regulation protein phosphatase SiaA [Crenobacter luteus]|uniref:biofilm regulation protein phosphatase SiaA n=1 Tax=Crenobacter luteus TaxID=1452487 RepID=UPI0022B23BBA|nr:biofilm regulation protein phosphatase SiaA [Crenobacter luteus]